MLLKDIVIEHTKKSRKGGLDEIFVMHPFENTQGVNVGKYEILRDFLEPGEKKKKRSGHVTLAQLAELYARELIDIFGILLRLRPAEGNYPTAPPAKKVPITCIKTDSGFDRLVQGVNTLRPIGMELKAVLKRLNVVVL